MVVLYGNIKPPVIIINVDSYYSYESTKAMDLPFMKQNRKRGL